MAGSVRKRSKSASSVRYLSAEMGRRRILSARPRRGQAAWRVRLQRLIVVLVLLAVAGGTLTAVTLGIRTIGRRLLWENDAYRLRTVSVTVEGRLPAENVLEFLSLPEDVNLWALLLARRVAPGRMTAETILNIDQMRERFLSRVPSVSGVEIAVDLPERMTVRVTERVPRAIVDRDGAYGDFVVDRHGVVFFAPRRDNHLPVIYGIDAQAIRPGMDLSVALTAALRLLEAVGHPEFNREFHIRDLRLAAADYIECILENGVQVRLAWPDMHNPEAASGRDLTLKLRSLRAVLQENRDHARTPQTIDLTLTEDNIPVTYAAW